MKSFLSLLCLSTLLLIPACQQGKDGGARIGNTVQDSTIVGHWFERIEDRARVKVEKIGTGRELLDDFYGYRRHLEITYSGKTSGLVMMARVHFSDSTAHVHTPCILWQETKDREAGDAIVVFQTFNIIPREKFDRDYIKVQ